MLSLFLSLIFTATVPDDQCTLISDGIVLSKYHLKNCTACVKFNPIYEEIKARAAMNQLNIKFREVECGTCDCGDISRFPTLQVTEDKSVKGTTTGYKDYQSFTKWLSDTLLIDHNLFSTHIDHEEGLVKTLKAADFLNGFTGPWMILFYDDPKDPRHNIFKELAIAYKNKVTFAKIEANDAQTVLARYNIIGFPFVMAINTGTPVPYAGKVDYGEMSHFVEKLYTPAFQEIKYSELRSTTKDLANGEPVFVVLYKNYEVASFYFNELAQQFKFKAMIQRSSDPAMFSAAGFHPKDTHDFDGEADHSQMVELTVYKNGTFFNANVKPDDTGELIQWIFHAHFPHVTNINNDNFYTVFHGIKPVILLLTSNDEFVPSFNKLSATWHLGAASSNIIFATLDTVEYPLFKKEVLAHITEPGIAFYDPVSSKWFYKKVKLDTETFNKTVIGMIDAYFNEKLPVYTNKKRNSSIFVFIGVGLVMCAFAYKMYAMRKKVD